MTDLSAYIYVLSNLVVFSKKGKVFNNLMENFQSFFFFRNSLHSTHLNASVLSNSAWRQHSFSPWEKAEKGAFTARSKVCRPRAPSVTSTPRSCTRVTAAFTHAAGGFSFGVTTKRRRHAWELHTDFFLLNWQFYPPSPPFLWKKRTFPAPCGCPWTFTLRDKIMPSLRHSYTVTVPEEPAAFPLDKPELRRKSQRFSRSVLVSTFMGLIINQAKVSPEPPNGTGQNFLRRNQKVWGWTVQPWSRDAFTDNYKIVSKHFCFWS